MSECPTSRRFRLNRLPFRHLLRHEQHHSQVTWFHAAEQAAEIGKHMCVFSGIAPQNVVGSLVLPEIRQLRRFFSIVEELVHWHFKCAGEFLKRLDSGNRMSVFHTRDVATEKPRSFLNLTL